MKKTKPLKIEYRNIEEIKPYELNNKLHPADQIEWIAVSITKYGYKFPVVLNSENILIAGHGRVEALKTLGFTDIQCVIADDLNEDQVKELRHVDNLVAEMGKTNKENVALDLQTIEFPELKTEYSEMHGIELNPMDLDDDFSLTNEKKGEIVQITFSLHQTQKEELERALDLAKQMGDFGETGNDNSNGNAIARVCEIFITQNEAGA